MRTIKKIDGQWCMVYSSDDDRYDEIMDLCESNVIPLPYTPAASIEFILKEQGRLGNLDISI